MIKDKLDSLITEAMKAKNSIKLKVLRLIKSEFQKFETTKDNKGNLNVLNEANEVKILKKMVSQWEEETKMFEQAHRDTSTLKLENDYLKSFLPKEMAADEQITFIKGIIDTYLKGLPIEERSTLKHLGAIVKIVKNIYPSIDGKLISDTYKEMLSI